MKSPFFIFFFWNYSLLVGIIIPFFLACRALFLLRSIPGSSVHNRGLTTREIEMVWIDFWLPDFIKKNDLTFDV